jgi:hypothetical protein
LAPWFVANTKFVGQVGEVLPMLLVGYCFGMRFERRLLLLTHPFNFILPMKSRFPRAAL